MKIVKSINDLKLNLQPFWGVDKSVGFVPTMGAIHDGHLSLVLRSVSENDISICSIFINPTQFNNQEDLEKYPVQIERDIEQLKMSNCDIVFVPSKEEIYESDHPIKFDFGKLATRLEGEFRSGHFSGVGLIVSKLFNLVCPDRAYFGQKDLQQLAIIKKLVKDLNFPVKIISVETKRDAYGLAMSSRNSRLSVNESDVATNIYKSLMLIEKMISEKYSFTDALQNTRTFLRNIDGLKLEYLEIVDSNSMEKVNAMDEADQISACVAAKVGGVRLIDNIYLKK